MLPPFINPNKLLDLCGEVKDDEASAEGDKEDDVEDLYRDFWYCIIFLIFSFCSSVLINQCVSSSISSVISDNMLSVRIPVVCVMYVYFQDTVILNLYNGKFIFEMNYEAG